MPAWKKASQKWLTLLAIFLLLLIITRLPQLSSGMLPDGDEAILGLMARHLAAGKELPLFFYGQSYGFCLLETATAACLFKIFGSSPVLLKVAMLWLWALGCLFLGTKRPGIRFADSDDHRRAVVANLSGLVFMVDESTRRLSFGVFSVPSNHMDGSPPASLWPQPPSRRLLNRRQYCIGLFMPAIMARRIAGIYLSACKSMDCVVTTTGRPWPGW